MNLVRFKHHNHAVPRYATPTIFDDIFDGLYRPFHWDSKPADLCEAQPVKVDIYEKDSAVFISAEMPGMKKEDISVDVKGKLVTLSGEKRRTSDVKEENYFRRESCHGQVKRTFRLPFAVDGDKVKASYVDGVLTLEIAKPEKQNPTQITVN